MIILYVFCVVNVIAAGYCAYSDMSRRGVQKTIYHSLMTVSAVLMMVVNLMAQV